MDDSNSSSPSPSRSYFQRCVNNPSAGSSLWYNNLGGTAASSGPSVSTTTMTPKTKGSQKSFPSCSSADNQVPIKPNPGIQQEVSSVPTLEDALLDCSAGLLPQLSSNTAHLARVSHQLESVASSSTKLRPAKKTVKHLKKKVDVINEKVTAGLESYGKISKMLDDITAALPDTEALDKKIFDMEEKMKFLQCEVSSLQETASLIKNLEPTRTAARTPCKGTHTRNEDSDMEQTEVHEDEVPLDLSPQAGSSSTASRFTGKKFIKPITEPKQKQLSFAPGTKRSLANPKKPKRKRQHKGDPSKASETTSQELSSSLEDFDLRKTTLRSSQNLPKSTPVLKPAATEARDVSFTATDPNMTD